MMTHQYKLSGLTCSNCVAKVKSELLRLPDVLSADVTQDKAVISMDRHIPLAQLQQAIGENGRYKITEDETDHSYHAMAGQETQSWLKTYKPLLLIAAFITGVSLIAAKTATGVNGMLWMQYFMAGFFLVFSFFKFLDLKGFAESYAMYDLLAKKVRSYGYVYPFIELTLGILFLAGFNLPATNAATIVIMGFSSIGVIQSVLDKKKIRCACLGAVFNLPMSTVTIVEDLVMVAMAAITIIIHQ
jgi:cation transport ATPase